MRPVVFLLLFPCVFHVAAEEFDSRLSVNTIVREDIFAGFLENNLERMAVGEKKIDALLPQRPEARADLLAWRAGAAMYRAIAAHEAKETAEFRRYYSEATQLFDKAAAGGNSFGLMAIQGGTLAILADRLPEPERQASWQTAYTAYRAMHKEQEQFLDRLPLHMKGELLAGLAMSAQRTGKAEEAAHWTEKILSSMPNTPYAARAMTWKSKPEMAARTGLACQSCHEAGRLAPSRAALLRQP